MRIDTYKASLTVGSAVAVVLLAGARVLHRIDRSVARAINAGLGAQR